MSLIAKHSLMMSTTSMVPTSRRATSRQAVRQKTLTQMQWLEFWAMVPLPHLQVPLQGLHLHLPKRVYVEDVLVVPSETFRHPQYGHQAQVTVLHALHLRLILRYCNTEWNVVSDELIIQTQTRYLLNVFWDTLTKLHCAKLWLCNRCPKCVMVMSLPSCFKQPMLPSVLQQDLRIAGWAISRSGYFTWLTLWSLSNLARFNMHDVTAIDADVDMENCFGSWSAPLWITPDHW